MFKQLVAKGIQNMSRGPCTLSLRSISVSHPDMRRNCPGQHKRLKEYSATYDNKWTTDLGSWTDMNKIVYPPLDEKLGRRPAEVYHGRRNVRYYPKKMYQVARFIRGMNVSEALARLQTMHTKASKIAYDVIVEAQELGEKEHNVEFKHNMHVARSFFVESGNIKFIRQRARGRDDINKMRFFNYHLMLREGEAPKRDDHVTALQAASTYVDRLRMREITGGL